MSPKEEKKALLAKCGPGDRVYSARLQLTFLVRNGGESFDDLCRKLFALGEGARDSTGSDASRVPPMTRTQRLEAALRQLRALQSQPALAEPFWRDVDAALSAPRDETALREFGLKVARAWQQALLAQTPYSPDIEAIVDAVLKGDGHPLADAFMANEGPGGGEPEGDPTPGKP